MADLARYLEEGIITRYHRPGQAPWLAVKERDGALSDRVSVCAPGLRGHQADLWASQGE